MGQSLLYCKVSIFLFILSSSSEGLAQDKKFNTCVAAHWGMEQGLPQSSVNDILQSSDGYIWLATFGGLVRFNSETFTTFNHSNSKGMRSGRILSLYQDKSGTLWCNTEDGLLRYSDGTFRAYTISDAVDDFPVSLIAEDGRGVLWIFAGGKAWKFFNDRFLYVPVVQNTQLARTAMKAHDGIWIANGTQVLRTYGDSVIFIKDFASVLTGDIRQVLKYPEHSTQLWLATNEDGIIRYANGTIRKFTMKDGLPSNNIRQLFIDRDGSLWTAGFKGASTMVGERFVSLRTTSREGDLEFNVIRQDREGNYWLGTPSLGLFRVRPTAFTMVDRENGLKETKMLSLFRRKNGTFLLGTNCGGIYEWNGAHAEYSQLNARLPNLCIWSVFEDSKGRIWIGSRTLTAVEPSADRTIIFDDKHGFTGSEVYAITEDSKGRIWIGCHNGMFIFDGTKFHHYTKSNGLTSNDIRSFYEDAKGIMWIGTVHGLNRFEISTITTVRLSASGDSLSHVESSYIRAIYQDSIGAMWFGTYGGGILRYFQGRFSTITTENGLSDNIVSHIVEDHLGYFWMGCNRGIMRVSKSDFHDVADGRKNTLRSDLFGAADGMNSPETNGGFQPSVARDRSGNLYFPTVDGVAIIAPEHVRQNIIPPPVYIEQVFSGTREMNLANDIKLPHDSSTIDIVYTALSFSDRSKILYRYKMEGLEERWTEAGNRTRTNYSNLPPGQWTFRVIASNNDGVWNMDGASVLITIVPPFWQTWWFYSIATLVFLVSGPSVYYWRVTQLKKEKSRQQHFAERLIDSQEKERRRIARELHDGLGQQIMIIKNRAEMVLNKQSSAEKMIEQLREIESSAVQAISDVRTISHNLRPVYLEQFGLTETIKQLFENLSHSTSIEWGLHVDDIDGIFPPEKEISFYRILQEGTNNILRHSAASQASIMVRRAHHELTVSLWDNGKGFDPVQMTNAPGLGISGIIERSNSFGGQCEILSQPGNSTTIKIIIPLARNG